MLEIIQEIDSQLLLAFMQAFSCPFLDTVMTVITKLGDNGFVWIAIGVLLLLYGNRTFRGRDWGMVTIISLAVNALLCNVILKPLIGRMRPYEYLGYEPSIHALGDASFPSGHTSAAFAAATAIYAMNPKWGRIAYVFATLMGLSRLYLGMHFPTDVICGGLLGIFAAWLTITIWKKLERKTTIDKK